MPRKQTTTADRLGGLLSNLTAQSAGAFPSTQEIVAREVPAEQRRLVRVPLDRLRPNPKQPRKIFVEEDLRALGASIKKDGLQQPLVIRAADVPGMYDIVVGERRWRAMLLEQMSEAEAIEVFDCPDEKLETIALIENVHRTDLTPYELAEAFLRLHRTPEGEVRMSIAEVAAKVNKSIDFVDSHLAIMRVPAKIRQLIIDDPKIPLRTIRDLGQVEDVNDLDYLIEEVRSHRYNANDISYMLQQVKKAQKKSEQRVTTKHDANERTDSSEKALPAEKETSVTAGAARKLSPALARAALETRLRRNDVQLQKILDGLTEELPFMDPDRKGIVRERTQTWVTRVQQVWDLAREE